MVGALSACSDRQGTGDSVLGRRDNARQDANIPAACRHTIGVPKDNGGDEGADMARHLHAPMCCGEPMRPIVYGMPGPELIESYERGDVALGGCVISEDRPRFECRQCGKTAGRIEDLDAHMRDGEW